MSGQVLLTRDGEDGRVAVVTLANPRKFNAMSRAMWRALKAVFTRVQASTDVRCVLLKGEGEHFCAGGDIAEYPDFRFDPRRLRDFHEDDVWGGLQAVLDCDVPIVAAIAGNCMGAGVEIASGCDIRVAAEDARFGAPIAKLGFPMAPREAQLVARALGETTARELLLEAAVLGAPEMKARGFLHRIEAPEDFYAHARERARRIAALAPQAARLNKRTLREISQSNLPLPLDGQAQTAIDNIAADAYGYADSPEHREGIAAFIEKRAPRF